MASRQEWKQRCTGTGSLAKKKQLLEAFLKAGGDLKSNLFLNAFASVSMSNTHSTMEEWVPWATIKNRFGEEESIARLKSGSILRRRDPKDNTFWEFKVVRQLERNDFTTEQKVQSYKEGKTDKAGYGALMAEWEGRSSGSNELPADLLRELGVSNKKVKALTGRSQDDTDLDKMSTVETGDGELEVKSKVVDLKTVVNKWLDKLEASDSEAANGSVSEGAGLKNFQHVPNQEGHVDVRHEHPGGQGAAGNPSLRPATRPRGRGASLFA